jgi:hypothetical protein
VQLREAEPPPQTGQGSLRLLLLLLVAAAAAAAPAAPASCCPGLIPRRHLFNSLLYAPENEGQQALCQLSGALLQLMQRAGKDAGAAAILCGAQHIQQRRQL